MAGLYEQSPYPGKLIVVEGIDGSGKSTQAQLLQKWLASSGVSVFFTEWNSSPLVKAATKMGKKKDLLTPTTFSLLHATDFADRFVYQIVPPLKAGMVVIADRYVFTAFARDTARGVDPKWVREVYSFAVRPDVSFYFRVPIQVSIDRLMNARRKIKYYEAGMDLGLSRDVQESYYLFQNRVLDEYDKMSEEFAFHVTNAEEAIDIQQRQMRRNVETELSDYFVRYQLALRQEEEDTQELPAVEPATAGGDGGEMS
ncbi:MAG: dTMP kinase [Chloroflexi bacterium]|nr:dTMP kinase [Chloroflexota bacterium]MCL5951667.1 dTMP kinase [Chloroflexota bacterium]